MSRIVITIDDEGEMDYVSDSTVDVLVLNTHILRTTKDLDFADQIKGFEDLVPWWVSKEFKGG